MKSEDVIRVLIDPFFAINVDPTIVAEHRPILSKAQWVQANCQLIEAWGPKTWLVHLLSVLEDEYPPSEAAIARAALGEQSDVKPGRA